MLSLADQYAAARRCAIILDRKARGRIALRGADRKTFLHALLTNDIAGLSSGAGCYAALLNPQGRFIADMYVFDLGDASLLDVHSDVTAELLARFDMLIFGEDVQLGDVTGVWGCLSIQGPESAAMLASVLDTGGQAGLAAELDGLGDLASLRHTFAGDTAVVARSDEYGAPGYWVYLASAHVASLGAALELAGATAGAPETGELLRIESGRPLFHVDLDEDTIPLEAGLDSRAISWTKGCYPGQEVIVRIRDRGHGRVVRRLVGLRGDGPDVPERGARIEADGKDVGTITSAAWSPALESAVALGYVHRDFTEPGTRVRIAHKNASLAATVTPLPFVEGGER
ncbi:MAG: glycine cleavage T C-terminal barrel domain-containing protein [Acidobacteriota bacterium]